jgi:hypothetical protein
MDAVRVSALVGKFKQIKEKITLEILFAIAGSWTRCVCLLLAGEFKQTKQTTILEILFAIAESWTRCVCLPLVCGLEHTIRGKRGRILVNFSALARCCLRNVEHG